VTVLSQFFGDRRKAQHHEASCLQVLVHYSFGVCCRVQEEVPRRDLYIAAANAEERRYMTMCGDVLERRIDAAT
jgi:predicted metal-binding transcription factor (methanogenesis marker protein 9)